MTLIDSTIEICHTSQPKASVIWLHGLGANGQDCVPILQMLALPEVRFILPDAPIRKVTINNGYQMRAWYDLFGFTPNSKEDKIGIQKTQQQLEQLIAKEVKRGMPSEKIVLAGFSQGGAIALHTGLRHQNTLAGMIVLSSYVPLRLSLALEKSSANQKTPIFMAHGRQDDIISIDACKASYLLLQSEGYNIDLHEYPIAHTICTEEVDAVSSFLHKILL